MKEEKHKDSNPEGCRLPISIYFTNVIVRYFNIIYHEIGKLSLILMILWWDYFSIYLRSPGYIFFPAYRNEPDALKVKQDGNVIFFYYY